MEDPTDDVAIVRVLSSWVPLPPPPFSLALYGRTNLSPKRIGGGGLLGARIREAVTRIGRGCTNDGNFYVYALLVPSSEMVAGAPGRGKKMERQGKWRRVCLRGGC